MKKTITLSLVLLFIVSIIYSKKLGTLSDIVNPFSITIDSGNVYIVEGPKVYIYSLKDLNFIKKFGKKGEGPEEFRTAPMTNMGNIMIDVYSEFILVNSLGKLSYFSKDGKYQKEIRATGNWRSFKLLSKKFVGFGGIRREENIRFISLKIYDSVQKEGLKFFEQQVFFNQGEVNPFFMIGPGFYTHNNKIYVEKDKKVIQVFNQTGKQIASIDINKGYKKKPVTKDDKTRFINYFKNEPAFKSIYERIKRDIKYYKYFPGIYNFMLADKKLYVFRWNDGSDNREISIFDLNGKLIKTTKIKFYMKDLMIPYAFTIKDGIIYQLVENEDDEGKWDLFATTI